MEEDKKQVASSVTEAGTKEERILHEPYKVFFTDVAVKQEPSEELTNYQNEDEVALSVTEAGLKDEYILPEPHKTDVTVKQEPSDELTNYEHEDEHSASVLPINLENMAEEADVHSVIKEEVIVANLYCQDINEVHASDATTVESITYTENNIQRDGFCRKSGPNEQSGLPEIYSNLSQICKCDVCNIYFANFSILSKHKLSKHSSIECSICKKPCSLPEHKLLHIRRKKKYQCIICNQTFTSKTSFITHKSTHKGEKPRCDICNKVFTQVYSLSCHKLIHSGIKKYQCDVCDKSFTQSSTLLSHKLIHSGVKNFQCDVCDKAFGRKYDLIQHKLIHSGVKKYQCDVCNLGYTKKSILIAHKLVHHGAVCK